jgi:DNA-binding transcriptional MerR regulator
VRKLEETVSIAVVAEQSGLTPRQIRYLDERGVEPYWLEIGGTKQRRYSENQVERLIAIADLKDQGYKLDAAVRLAVPK